MREKLKIICTIGPASFNEGVLRKFEARKVSLVRINLSHVSVEDIERYIHFLKKFNILIAIDTEGAQVRTGIMKSGPIYFNIDDIVFIHRKKITCNKNSIYFTPCEVVDYLKPGDLISLDFNSVLLKVEDTNTLWNRNFIKSRVIIQGVVSGNKGVHCEGLGNKLPTFSKKDLKAIDLAKQYGIKHFTLSFMNSADEVKTFKNLYPEAIAYAKIETKKGINNLEEILRSCEGILIDRGDLSREVPIQKMPLVQKILIGKARSAGKDVFIASNLVETMANDLKPSRAEANDIVNTVLDGVTGFVLTKETAVGKYPIETVNMLDTLIRQGQLAMDHQTKKKYKDSQHTISVDLSKLEKADYIKNTDAEGFLIEPHGGRLVNRMVDLEKITSISWKALRTLKIGNNALMDLEQLGIGTYSPLESFMVKDELESVIDKMCLRNGTVWTLPIILSIKKQEAKIYTEGEKIALVAKEDGEIYGLLDIAQIYAFDKKTYAKAIFGTNDHNHPGVKMLANEGEYLLGGKVTLVKRRTDKYHQYNLTPQQVRTIFESLGWAKVVGFHTRNVIHRSHEFIQMQAMEKTGCDGLFVQPIVGTKKKGDFQSEIIIKSYEIMLEKYYEKNKVIFGLFSTYSRYAGPREAVFTALCRQNFGCSHFIIGRDHAGATSYFGPKDSHEIFDKIGKIGITPVFFEEVGYDSKVRSYIIKQKANKDDFISISGTEIRNMLQQKKIPPKWIMRKEIAKYIIGRIGKKGKVFV